MDFISALAADSKTIFDLDVPAGQTVRSKVFACARGMPSMSLELAVTLLGAQPVNLTMRVLGQDTVPASDTTRLIPLSVAVPDTSALAANYSGAFLLSVFTHYFQVEFQNVSGGNVHVKCDAFGSETELPATSGAQAVNLSAALPAGTNKIGSIDIARNSPYTPKFTAANTTVNAFASQAVKTTVFIRADDTMTGTVTIADGTNAGVTLPRNGSAPFEVSNMNQLTYQFSINASTEKFSVSAGI
jgi:fluoride ion exporter CrcB/FEX